MKPFRLLIPTLIAAVLLGCAHGHVTHLQTEVTDPFAINTMRRLTDLETGASITGKALLAARSHFTGEQWNKIADTSMKLSAALYDARAQWTAYVDKVVAGDTAGIERTALEKAIDAAQFLALTYEGYKKGG